MIQTAINTAIQDSQLYTLNMLKEYLKSKDVQETDRVFNLLDNFSENVLSAPLLIKKKKEPSNFNIFIGNKIKEYKMLNPEYDGQYLMKLAIEDWKEHKEKNMFIV